MVPITFGCTSVCLYHYVVKLTCYPLLRPTYFHTHTSDMQQATGRVVNAAGSRLVHICALVIVEKNAMRYKEIREEKVEEERKGKLDHL